MKRNRILPLLLCAALLAAQAVTASAAGRTSTAYYRDNGVGSYNHDSRLAGYEVQLGVDVSDFQGSVNWRQVKAAGVEFAMIRLGGRWYGDSGSKSPDDCFYLDDRYRENMRGAAAAGIPTGVYFFSQAVTPEEAVEEARYVLRNLGTRPALPVAMDVEYPVRAANGQRLYTGRLYRAGLSRRQATDVCLAFCREIRAAGHTPMVYGNADMFNNHLYMDEISSAAEVWIATFGTDHVSGSGYWGEHTMWQFSDKGRIGGISGDADLDFRYVRPLDTPRLNTPTGENNGVRVSWGAVSGAAKYRVFVKGGDYGAKWTKLADTAGTDYVHTAARAGVSYTYTVRCLSADGESFTSSYDASGKTITYLAAPRLNVPTGENSGVWVTWSAVPGAAQYRVFVKGGGYGSSKWVGLGNTAGTSFIHTAAVSGTRYTYTVRCLSADGRSFTGGFDAAGKAITYLPAPRLNAPTAEANGVKLTWSAVPGAAQYRVFVKGGSYGDRWTRLADVSTAACVHTAAVSGVSYTYTVRCLSADGKSFTGGYDAAGRTITYLAAPRLNNPTGEVGGVKVTWSAVPGAARYRVFVKGGDYGSGKWVGIGNTTGTGFVHTAAVSGVSYTYTVRCLSADGKSFASGYDAAGKSITYTRPAGLATPGLNEPTAGAVGVKITWRAVPGAAQYRVFVKGGSYGSGKWVGIGNTTGTGFIHTDVVSGVSYTYTVRCLSADGKSFTSGYDAAGKTIVYTSPAP